MPAASAMAKCVTVQIEDIDPAETLQNTACGCLGALKSAHCGKCSTSSLLYKASIIV